MRKDQLAFAGTLIGAILAFACPEHGHGQRVPWTRVLETVYARSVWSEIEFKCTVDHRGAPAYHVSLRWHPQANKYQGGSGGTRIVPNVGSPFHFPLGEDGVLAIVMGGVVKSIWPATFVDELRGPELRIAHRSYSGSRLGFARYPTAGLARELDRLNCRQPQGDVR